jgi:hypothetical protein
LLAAEEVAAEADAAAVAAAAADAPPAAVLGGEMDVVREADGTPAAAAAVPVVAASRGVRVTGEVPTATRKEGLAMGLERDEEPAGCTGEPEPPVAAVGFGVVDEAAAAAGLLAAFESLRPSMSVLPTASAPPPAAAAAEAAAASAAGPMEAVVAAGEGGVAPGKVGRGPERVEAEAAALLFAAVALLPALAPAISSDPIGALDGLTVAEDAGSIRGSASPPALRLPLRLRGTGTNFLSDISTATPAAASRDACATVALRRSIVRTRD